MTDPASIIRARFPNWQSDPYQKAAVDALLRVLFSCESVATQLDSIETALQFFLDDPPLSLLFDAPSAQLETAAKKTAALALELRKAATAIRDLAPYVDQFNPRTEEPHAGIREEVGHPDEPSAAPDYGEAPF